MHYVIQKIFAADGSQIDSDSRAEFADFKAAQAMADRLTDAEGHPALDGSHSEFYVVSD
jgi:hypothetical protein